MGQDITWTKNNFFASRKGEQSTSNNKKRWTKKAWQLPVINLSALENNTMPWLAISMDSIYPYLGFQCLWNTEWQRNRCQLKWNICCTTIWKTQNFIFFKPLSRTKVLNYVTKYVTKYKVASFSGTLLPKIYLWKKIIDKQRNGNRFPSSHTHRETHSLKFLTYELFWQEFKFLEVFLRLIYYLKPIKMLHIANLSPSTQVVLKHTHAMTTSHFYIFKVS